MKARSTYYIYILLCQNNTYYTGYTTDIDRRYQEHVEGSPKCKYTRSFPPKKIAATWKIESDLSFAMKVESAIKRLPKTEKIRLIKDSHNLAELSLEDLGEYTIIKM